MKAARSVKVRTKWGRKLKRKVVPPKIKTEGDDISLSGPIRLGQIKDTFAGRSFNSVDFRDTNFIDLQIAYAICQATSIRSIGIWSNISRAAFSRLMNAEGLQEALVSGFAGSGRFRDFASANAVVDFRSFYGLNGLDLVEIANLPNLISLTAHGAEFGTKAMQRLAEMPTLRQVDLEAVTITDEMSRALSKSRSVTDVVVPATRLTKMGLRHISEMPQLRYIDIWANNFQANALEMFAGHPALEIVELGTMGYDPDRVLHARDIIPQLEKLPKLTTVYFENVATTDEECAYLKSRYTFRLMQEKH